MVEGSVTVDPRPLGPNPKERANAVVALIIRLRPNNTSYTESITLSFLPHYRSLAMASTEDLVGPQRANPLWDRPQDPAAMNKSERNESIVDAQR